MLIFQNRSTNLTETLNKRLKKGIKKILETNISPIIEDG